MESGFWGRLKAVIAACFAGVTHPSPEERGQFANRPYEGVNLAPRSGFIAMSRGGALIAPGATVNMKIMIFSINMDKFTMFFDKFLKFNTPANDCNQVGYYINLSVLHSDMAAKKFFGSRAFARSRPHFLSHRIMTRASPSLPGQD